MAASPKSPSFCKIVQLPSGAEERRAALVGYASDIITVLGTVAALALAATIDERFEKLRDGPAEDPTPRIVVTNTAA